MPRRSSIPDNGNPPDASDSVIALAPDVSSAFKPKVLQQIFLFTNPADSVVCLVVQWHIRSVASHQLHNHLATTRNGALVLKYPLSFANKDDLRCAGGLCRFTNLIKYRIGLRFPDENRIVIEFQKFLTGYEAMMLSEVMATAEIYTDLATFAIDFTLPEEEPPTISFASAWQFDGYNAHERRSPSKWQSSYSEFRSIERSGGLFMAWPLWAETIRKVIAHSACSITSLVFVAPQLPLGLPPQFYGAVRFDQLLAKTKNLQLLYMPALRAYVEGMLFTTKSQGGNRSSSRAWPALYQLPENDRLPNLRRIVVSEWDELCHYQDGDQYFPRILGGCGLPSFVTKPDVISVARSSNHLSSVSLPIADNRLVFPVARILPEKICINAQLFVDAGQCAAIKICHSSYYDNGENEGSETWSFFANEEVWTKRIISYVKTLHASGAIPLVHQQTFANEKLFVSVQCSEDLQTLSESSSKPAWAKAFREMLSATTIIPVRFTFTVQHAENGWGVIRANSKFVQRQLLPLFNDAGTLSIPTNLLAACRLVIESKYSLTFSKIVKDWTTCGSLSEDSEALEEKRILFAQQFKFPPISFHAESERFSWGANERQWLAPIPLKNFYSGNISEDIGNDDEKKLQVVDTLLHCIDCRIKKKIDVFLNDAVDAYRRRNLPFYLYQSLAKCRFVFSFKVLGRSPSKLEEHILALLDTASKARFAQLETDFLTKIRGCCLDSCLEKYALALPALKSLKVYAEFHYDEKLQRRN